MIYPENCDDGPETHSPPFQVEACLPDCSENDAKWVCSGGNLTSRSICFPLCGDNLKVGNESCDNGSNPGCLPDCSAPSPGYECPNNVCSPICGDGKLFGNEKCDSGPKEGCNSDCFAPLIEYSCEGGDQENPSICTKELALK